MKVLLDTCVAGPLVAPALVAAGHDAIWAGDWKAIRAMRLFWDVPIRKAAC